MIDPRESPFYDGPELQGLSPDEKFDLAKQLRIAARNKRLAMKYGDERVKRERLLPHWFLIIGFAVIVFGLTAAIEVVRIWPK